MDRDLLEVNGVLYPVKVHYDRRPHCTVTVRQGGINIRIPSSRNRKERSKKLSELKRLVAEKISKDPGRFKHIAQRSYNDGDRLVVGDDEYTLHISYKDKKSSSAVIEGNTIRLLISLNLSPGMRNDHISTLISRCVAQRRIDELRKKVAELNRLHFNQPLKKISFKHNRSNWGSCSRAGNINISTRLLFAPDDVLEYVCVHELAHLIEPNHSSRFWGLVKSAMPDYREKIKWLKENGNRCDF